MNYIQMHYKGFTFPVNPAAVETSLSKRLGRRDVLFAGARIQETGEAPAVIRGRGCFIGEQASEQAQQLMKLFKEHGSAYLFAPEFYPLKAFFTELTFSTDAQNNRIDYTFTFTEDCVNKQSHFLFRYTYARAGENLFDIANRTGVATETLFAANDYEDLFSVSEGDKVWLK